MYKIILASLLFASNVYADTFNLAWDATTQDSDGAPLTAPLQSYKLYVSTINPVPLTTPFATITAPTTTRSVVQNVPGTYFAVVTAVNANGESLPSNTISFQVLPKVPKAPATLRIAP
jgi:hypothetical protein